MKIRDSFKIWLKIRDEEQKLKLVQNSFKISGTVLKNNEQPTF